MIELGAFHPWGQKRSGTRRGGFARADRLQRHHVAGRSVLPRFLLLYALIYAAYGVEGPFLPSLLAERGLSAEAISLVFAAGTAVRLLSAPVASAVADRHRARGLVLAGALLAAALLGCGLALAADLPAILLVSLLLAVALAPINPMADALAAAPGQDPRRRDKGASSGHYGLVRGTGSGAFVAGALLAGPIVASAGFAAPIWINAGLLALAAAVAIGFPRQASNPTSHDTGGGAACRPAGRPPAALRQLLGMPLFRRLLLLTGLVQGSHALYGVFATLHWQSAGIAPETIGALWGIAVASEVAVFVVAGPWLLRRIGPGGLASLAAAAGVLRWSGMACTDALAVQFALQPLHGLTFAALHLATVRLLAVSVPPGLAASAYSLQASLGPGLAGALLTLAAGPLYASVGAGGFWVMAALCAAALPLSASLTSADENGGSAEAATAGTRLPATAAPTPVPP